MDDESGEGGQMVGITWKIDLETNGITQYRLSVMNKKFPLFAN